jgi:hypothetical protein
LPYRGCAYCQRLEEQWERFSEEVDYMFLDIRQVHSSKTVCNWMDGYNLKEAQINSVQLDSWAWYHFDLVFRVEPNLLQAVTLSSNVKLIRYQFWCTRYAFRLIKSLQWCLGWKRWKSEKKNVKSVSALWLISYYFVIWR